jgi:hypothetical protein
VGINFSGEKKDREDVELEAYNEFEEAISSIAVVED